MTSPNEDEASERPPRRRYQVPAVIESAVFETLALACGKDNATTITCDMDFGGTLTTS